MMKNTTLWPRLTDGALALVAPASPVAAADLDQAMAIIKSAGRQPLVFGDPTAPTSPRKRAEALFQAFSDPATAAVISLRGGSGSAELLPFLADQPFSAHPKPFWGYSDVTSLHLMFNSVFGMVTFHTPMPAEPKPRRPGTDEFRRILERLSSPPPWEIPLPEAVVHRLGKAAGQLFGGNLTVLCHLLGTPYFPPMGGVVLVIEDVNEPAYKIRRLFTHLQLAGVLGKIRGLLVGNLGMDPAPLLKPVIEAVDGPVVSNLPVGHLAGQEILPLGAVVKVTTDPPNLVLGHEG